MTLLITWKRALVAAVAAVACVALAVGLTISPGTASALSGGTALTSAMALAPGRGQDDFGMTRAYFAGRKVGFTYSHGFFCDTTRSSSASSKCEVGQKWAKAPSPQHDPLFITVPLGFSPGRMPDCPPNLTCVDHPMTVDLTRLEPALKPLYPQLTDAQLTEALKDFKTPQHDHFITDKNNGKREWWDVYVVGVTSPKTFQRIQNHQSYRFIRKLINQGNKHVLGPIPSNIFLFFSVKK